MTEHTPEPWGIQNDTCARCRKEGREEFVFSPGPSRGYHGTIDGRADAEHIVACVNACAGINPKAVPHWRDALENALIWLRTGAAAAATDNDDPAVSCWTKNQITELKSDIGTALARAEEY